MKQIGVVQNGFGKMGREVYERLHGTDIAIVGIADPALPVIPFSGRRFDFPHQEKDVTKVPIEPGYVLVDFSTPQASLTAAHYAAENGAKLVIGTTPLPKEIEDEIASLSEKTSVMICPNYSPDVNRFFYLMRDVGAMSDPEAQEWVSVYERHRAEKPSVSGTALEISRILGGLMEKDGYIIRGPDKDSHKAYDLDGNEIQMPEMSPDSLRNFVQIAYERFADEPGLHVVTIGNENDYSRFEVRATRSSYAHGVESAVRYIAGVDKGRVDFARDLLRLA